jgi:hypothetical protein
MLQNKFRFFGDGRKKKRKMKGDVCPAAGIFSDVFSLHTQL